MKYKLVLSQRKYLSMFNLSMFNKVSLCALSLGSLFTVGSVQAAETSVQFLLNGKPVNSVPVDKLGDIQIVVKSGGPNFKQLWSGQWQGLDQSLNVVAAPYKKGASMPSLDNSHQWKGYSMSKTTYDSTWATKTELKDTMRKAAMVNGLALFDASSEDTIAFTTRLRRQVYTGKTIYQNGGYVKETRWETAGPPRGNGQLKLEPPTFAASLNPEQLFTGAVQQLNATPKSEYDNNRAMLVSRSLLYPTSYGGRKVDFKGSKILTFSSINGAKPVFNWNYLDADGSQWVFAKFPVNMQIQALMMTTYDSAPVPTKTEAVFLCPMEMNAKRKIGTSQWVADDVSFNDETLTACRTAEGKTPADVVKSPGTMTLPTLDTTKSPEDQAKDILNGLKGLGF
jgi:hypothetical protein